MSKSRDIADSAATINYIDTVTSNVQDQIDNIDPLPSQTGNAGNYLTTDGTTASWGEISASPTHQAIASGSLADGDLVIANPDGTISSVEGNVAAFSNAAYWWSGTTGYYHSTAYDSDTGAYIMMALPGGGTSNPGYNVATISGNTITVGTFSTLTTTAAANGKVVYNELWNKVAFLSQNGYSWGAVDAVNRTVTWQSVAGFTNWTHDKSSLNYDDVSGRMIQIGRPYNGYYYVRIFYSSTGSNMSASSPISVEAINTSGTVNLVSTVNLGDSKFLTAAPMGTNLGLRSFITTITGNTTATFGAFQSVVSGVTISDAVVAYSPDSNKALIVFKDASNSFYLSYKLGTVNGGSSVSWGSSIVITTSNNNAYNAVYDTNTQKFIIWSGTGDKSIYEGVYTSGNELTLTKTISNYTGVSANNNTFAQFIMDTANNKVIWNAGDRVVDYSPESTNLTEGNYIGISNGSYSDAETATVQVAGSVDDAQSGLTAGQKYYALVDGTLSTTAGIPEVVVGTSVSSSEIIVKG